MATIAAHAAPSSWHDRVLELLQRQHDLFRQLDELSRSQGSLVESGDTSRLLPVLSARRKVVDAITRTSRDLEPLREGWEARLDRLEERLSWQRYLTGGRITEADWRLFTTLVRFDPVYVGHFKCNIRRIADYPRLSAYLADLLGIPGVRETVHLDHIKHHYYGSHKTINPTGIVPVGPKLDWAT